MTASDYQSSYERLQLGLAITLGIKMFIVSYDYTTMNEVNRCYSSGEGHWKVLAMQKQSSLMFFKVSRSPMFFKVTASGDGSSIFSKARGYVFIKKLNFIHQGFLLQFKKSFIPETLSRSTCFWRMFVNGYILKNWKLCLTSWKKKKKRKSVIKTFRLCYFGQHVFPLRSIEAWNWSIAVWVRSKLTVYYWLVRM